MRLINRFSYVCFLVIIHSCAALRQVWHWKRLLFKKFESSVEESQTTSNQQKLIDGERIPNIDDLPSIIQAPITELIAKEGKDYFKILHAFILSKDLQDEYYKEDYYFQMKEAELKHGRIAMLAAIGWPFSELYHYQFSSTLGIEDSMGDNGRAPSVLNGGLDNGNVIFALSIIFLMFGWLEIQLMKQRMKIPEQDNLYNFYNMWREDGWDAPGNYGWDPLHLTEKFGTSREDRIRIQSLENWNGRIAMLAVMGYVVQEYWTQLPVITETPEFFGL
jgi:hypothetical protein